MFPDAVDFLDKRALHVLLCIIRIRKDTDTAPLQSCDKLVVLWVKTSGRPAYPLLVRSKPSCESSIEKKPRK